MKSYDVRWSHTAEIDLNNVLDYLSDKNIDAAMRVFAAITEKSETLAFLPEKGRMVPELHAQGISMYRELIYKNWRIIYRITGSTVCILACLDSRRNLEDLLLQRFLD